MIIQIKTITEQDVYMLPLTVQVSFIFETCVTIQMEACGTVYYTVQRGSYFYE